MDAVESKTNKEYILCLNPGSSSLKWALFYSLKHEQAEKSGSVKLNELASTIVKILNDHNVSLVIIRFVHGGIKYFEPIEINTEVLVVLEKIKSLAPMHMQASLRCSECVNDTYPNVKQIAVFDTELYRDLPEVSQLYGLPKLLIKKYGIRRFGFHGFAHAGMLTTYEKINSSMGINKKRVVTMQLGSGCSMTAFQSGTPVETSMGFTPNDGLLMSTRSGDLDPGLVTWLQRQENWTPDETDEWLNEKSGWCGLSGESTDFSTLLKNNNENTEKAIQLFSYRIRKTLGAYYAILGGLDAILLSGGIAEHAIEFCRNLLSDLEHLGITLSSKVISVKKKKLADAYIPLTSKEAVTEVWIVQNSEFNMMISAVNQIINSVEK